MTITAQRWRENWRVIAPSGAVRVDMPRGRAARRAALDEVNRLPAGTPVVILARAPGAIFTCKNFVGAARVAVEREYLTFPSVAAPGHLIEDARASITSYVGTVLVAPPGKRYSRPLELCFAVLRAVPSWRLVRRIAPGRAVVGRRV